MLFHFFSCLCLHDVRIVLSSNIRFTFPCFSMRLPPSFETISFQSYLTTTKFWVTSITKKSLYFLLLPFWPPRFQSPQCAKASCTVFSRNFRLPEKGSNSSNCSPILETRVLPLYFLLLAFRPPRFQSPQCAKASCTVFASHFRLQEKGYNSSNCSPILETRALPLVFFCCWHFDHVDSSHHTCRLESKLAQVTAAAYPFGAQV